jgi:hypothetical protein
MNLNLLPPEYLPLRQHLYVTCFTLTIISLDWMITVIRRGNTVRQPSSQDIPLLCPIKQNKGQRHFSTCWQRGKYYHSKCSGINLSHLSSPLCSCCHIWPLFLKQLGPVLCPYPYIVHYIWPQPIWLKSKVAYYIGNRVPFRTQPLVDYSGIKYFYLKNIWKTLH